MIYRENLDLTNYNTYRIPATVHRAYFPQNAADLVALCAQHRGDPILFFGNGSNLIFSKPRYEKEIFVFIREEMSTITVTDDRITAQAGATLEQLSETARDAGLAGMEIFWDIPGTVGGGVYMNAGAYDGDLWSLLESVEWVDTATGTLRTARKEELAYGYRQSAFQKMSAVITRAVFRLSRGDNAAITEKMNCIREERHCKQPWDMPSAGSVFKRPQGRFVGQMIEELNLKGYRIGGAEVSPKHAGFVVNSGGATGADILALVAHIQQKVRERYGVELELEQQVV